jgi:hypothetical protein
LVIALTTLLGAGAARAQLVPLGPEFQVNSYTTNSQNIASTSIGPQGQIMVVWQSAGSSEGDNSSNSIQARLLASNGSILGPQFQVNVYSTSYQRSASISALPQGGFIVVWESAGSTMTDLAGASIQGRLLDSSGMAVTSEFQVNTYTTGSQTFAKVAAGPTGEFIVVWQDEGPLGMDTSGTSVQARRFASNGIALGEQFQVNTYITDNQRAPRISFGAEGQFIVTWTSSGSAESDNDLTSVHAQHFSSTATPLNAEFQVNTYTTGAQLGGSVVFGPQGQFVIVWNSRGSAGSDSDGYSVQARLYDSVGMPQGEEFQINTYTTSTQTNSTLARLPSGDFVIAWQSYGSGETDTSSFSIQGQSLAMDGTPLGPEFQINTYTTGRQTAPSISALSDGRLVLTWDSQGSAESDQASPSIQARFYSVTIPVTALPSTFASLLLLTLALLGAALFLLSSKWSGRRIK